ncbi:MAG: hypothetical protein DRJ10_20205, partial [Bacteroidetes bacterium]
LKIEESSSSKIIWQTNINDKLWFSAEFDNHFNINGSSNNKLATYLTKLFKAARRLNPNFVVDFGYDILSEINFDISWGLGSSSSLISNIAWWANVDPFQLFMLVSNGSGYDIACARSEKPILYKLNDGDADYKQVDFFPEFHSQIYFAYLGKKQNSEESVHLFKQKAKVSPQDVQEVSDISNAFLNCKNSTDYSRLMFEHEQIIANVLNEMPVKKAFFNDFEGEIKSLGAWGGDFIMISSELPIEKVKSYFSGKGINILFSFNDIRLS